MSEQNTTQNATGPYRKKLTAWETEITEIENYINKLQDVDIFLLLPLLFLSNKDKIVEKREQLDKIKAGLKKMTETLSSIKPGDSSETDLDNYGKRIVHLSLKINKLINELSKKDAVQYLKSILNND